MTARTHATTSIDETAEHSRRLNQQFDQTSRVTVRSVASVYTDGKNAVSGGHLPFTVFEGGARLPDNVIAGQYESRAFDNRADGLIVYASATPRRARGVQPGGTAYRGVFGYLWYRASGTLNLGKGGGGGYRYEA